MKPRPFALRLIALLVLAAISMAPFGDAMAVARTAAGTAHGSDATMDAMDMAAMAMDAIEGAIPCCPDATPQPRPAADCDKSACLVLASCTQQCIPAAPSAVASSVASPGQADMGHPPVCGPLASLNYEPPPRPPRA